MSRRAVGLSALLAALGVLVLTASPAAADRTYDSQITGLTSPWGVAVDGSDNVWVSDTGNAGLISEYDAYPSQTKIGQQDGGGNFTFGGSYIHSLSLNDSTGALYVGDSGQVVVDIFDGSGAFDKQLSSSFGSGYVYVAVDNSTGATNGDLYAASSGGIPVQRFDSDGNPVDFSASGDPGKSYISGNQLTGTPAGGFGKAWNVAVDTAGNIYVLDQANSVVDEFDSSGTFVRAFDGTGAPGSFSNNLGGVAVDPTNDNVLVLDSGNGVVDEFDSTGAYVDQITGTGPSEATPFGSLTGGIAVNSSGYIYVVDGSGPVDIFTPNAILPQITYGAVTNQTQTGGTVNAGVDLNGGPNVTSCSFQYGTTASYGSTAQCLDSGNTPIGTVANPITGATDVHADLSGLTTEATYHYRLVLTTSNGSRKAPDQTYLPHAVESLATDPATDIAPSSATLNGSFNGDGEDTNYYFEWGVDTSYGNETAVPPGPLLTAPNGPQSVSFDLGGLNPVTTYHYRIVATNGTGTSFGDDRSFTTNPNAPSIVTSVSDVHSDTALLHAQIDPGGGSTSYHFEWGTDDCVAHPELCTNTPIPDASAGSDFANHNVSAPISGLAPGTIYHFRVVATNAQSPPGGTVSADRTFTTFPFGFNDTCPNAHVRQQTGAALLLDCRAYELVSASDTGGYNVESDLVAGQMPYGGYPDAENPPRVLYGVHNGGIPGTGIPTNKGVDPYVATRDPNSGWSTKYVGIPANDPNASGPFASTLAGADQGLESFAFGGPGICSPCFGDGSTGIPIHNPDGSLSQGMVGSNPISDPVSAGVVTKPFSADGSHLIFGSEQQFENTGNPDDGNVTIYSRNLDSATTEVASTDTGGTALADGSNVAELDVSSNGQRVVIGDLVSTDSAGNHYYHLYMHIAGRPDSIDLTPGTPDGALYDGMSSDGTKVYFTTSDVPTGASDSDNSADIFEMDLSDPQSPQLSRVSTGTDGTGDTSSCNPAANSARPRWNSVGTSPNCNVVAVGGGGGVASGDGTIYFLSPELLDGSSNGVQDAPNVYLARPGQAPRFVATLESSGNAPLPPAAHSFQRTFGSFTNPTGIAIDHSDGDAYVLDIQNGVVEKFDPSGHLVSSFATNGKLDGSAAPTGAFQESADFSVPDQIAVDQSSGDLYVPDFFNSEVDIFDSAGNYISQISVILPSGVAVDQANGHVYVSSYFGGVDVFDSSGNPVAPTSFSSSSFTPTAIAVDSSGNSYVSDGSKTEMYDAAGNDVKALDSNPSYGVSVDPADDHVYVNEGDRVVEFDASGTPTGVPTGTGLLSNAVGVVADSGNLEVANKGAGNVAVFGPSAVPPDPDTDNPLVIDSVGSANARQTADFEVSPSGDFAAFTSTLPLTGYDNASHREVFRYDAANERFDCASCNPTGAQAIGEASMATNGLSLTDDGRVFFDSTDALVDRDLNNKKDAYEWESGKGIDLISNGTDPLDSSLLGVSADGTDAYFFTHATLVSADQNGGRVKIYDARVLGGFPFVPAAVPCKASDECHGASSPIPPPPIVNTTAGTPVGNAPQARKKKHHRRHRHHKRAHHKRRGKK